MRRERVHQEVQMGGRDVPDIPLKLDVVFFSFLCRSVQQTGGHHFLPSYYRQVVSWGKKHKECQEGDLCFSHRHLYGALVEKRGPMGVYGVGQQGWVFTQQKGLTNRARDIN